MKNKAMISLILIVFWHTIAAAQTTPAAYFKKLTLTDIQNSPLSTQRIDGKADALPVGTIMTYETNEHRKGKLLIHEYGYDLTIHWVTYRADGQIYRSGWKTVVRGTYLFDLDDAGSNPAGYDFWWEQVDDQQRFIVPRNGAKFSVFKQGVVENDGNIYPYSLKQVKLSNKVELAYADEGAGDVTLLFIHGLGGYHQVWKKNIDELRKSYRCIAPDMPGCGKSSQGDYLFTIDFLANTVLEFIDSLHLKNVILVGHSMGGQVVLTAAAKRSTTIKKVIVLASSGLKVYSAFEKSAILFWAKPKLTRNRSDFFIKAAFDTLFSDNKLPIDAKFMLDYRLNLKNRPEYFNYFAEMIYQLNRSILDEPVVGLLKKIAIPVLILWGEQDYLISPEQAQIAGNLILDNNIHVFSPCGHLLQWECSPEINEAITQFVQPQYQSSDPPPVALIQADQRACIAPCTMRFINKSVNADHYIWMVNDNVVSREKDLIFTIKKVEGYKITLIAKKGNQSDTMEIFVRGMGE